MLSVPAFIVSVLLFSEQLQSRVVIVITCKNLDIKACYCEVLKGPGQYAESGQMLSP